jgi:hypothetical protein
LAFAARADVVGQVVCSSGELAVGQDQDSIHYPNIRAHIERGENVGAVVMLGTLFGLILAIFALVLRFDPESRRTSTDEHSP